jgi:glycosyltransferase involved in cell wall biosynthesis
MKSKLITIIPVRNGAEFIGQALDSVADQTLQPDRVIVQDNCSTDNTEEVVKAYNRLNIEWVQNGSDTLSIGNFNRGLENADQTEYLHLLCADDTIKPKFYQRLIHELDSCPGVGMAYCLDERIDQNNQKISVSGKETGTSDILKLDDYLRAKAEYSNQAVSGTLFKTAGQKAPCKLRDEFIIVWDAAFHAEWASHSKRIVRVNEALSHFRWHDSNGTLDWAPKIGALVLAEWQVMQMVEKLRQAKPGFIRRFKLQGMFGVRSGIKALRYRQSGNPAYAQQIVKLARPISGPLAWYMAQAIVHAREVAVYKIGGRRRHPQNIYA